MSLLKKLAGQTALYGLSSIVGRALNFLLVPFYTAVLGAAELGVITEVYAIVGFLNVLYLFGMETTFFRFATRENFTEKEAFNNSLSSVLIASFLFSGLIIFFSPQIATALWYPGKGSYFMWLGLILAIDAISAIPFAKLRLEQKAGKFAFAKIFNIGVNIFFNIFFLVFCKQVHEGKLLSELQPFVNSFYSPENDVEYIFISNFLASLLTLPFLLKSFIKFRFTINFKVLKPMLMYSYPIMFIGFTGMIDEMLSRIILKYVLPQGFYENRTNVEALGIFGACYRLSMFMSLAIQAFRYAADPFFFSQAQNKNAPELYAKVMKYFIIVCCSLFLIVSLNLSIFQYLLVKPIFREGIMVVPILLLANMFSGIYYNLSFWYKLTDKTHFGLYISILGAIVTVVLNLLLIPILGYMGSALTTLACYVIMCITSYSLGQKYYPVPYKIFASFGYIALSVLLAIAALSYPFEPNTISAYAFQTLLFTLFIILVFLFERKNFNRVS